MHNWKKNTKQMYDIKDFLCLTKWFQVVPSIGSRLSYPTGSYIIAFDTGNC